MPVLVVDVATASQSGVWSGNSVSVASLRRGAFTPCHHGTSRVPRNREHYRVYASITPDPERGRVQRMRQRYQASLNTDAGELKHVGWKCEKRDLFTAGQTR